MEVEFANIPPDLTNFSQWVLWRTEIKGGKPTKVPKNPATGFNASSIDPETWSTFDVARVKYENGNYDGIGFVFTEDDHFCGIDLDKCRDPETGEIDPGTQWIIDHIHSYTEVSPSETGVKIFAIGELPNRKKGNIEAYSSKRFFTMTGAHLPETPKTPQDRKDILIRFAREYFPPPSERPPERSKSSYTGTEAEVLHKAKNAKNGDRFGRLWNGNWQKDYPSQSEADLALCSALMFWTGNDADMADALFRKSGLMREKWDHRRGELTYGEKTLETAYCTTPPTVYIETTAKLLSFSGSPNDTENLTPAQELCHDNNDNNDNRDVATQSMIVTMGMVRDWVERATGVFKSRDLYQELDIFGREDRKKVYVYLSRLADEGVIKRHGRIHGTWRKLDDVDDNVIDFKNAETGPGVDLWLPFGLHKMVKIYPGNVIVVAGEINSGKTSFVLNIARYNMHKHDVFYLSSEMEGDELKERLEAFEGMTVHDWGISAHRVADNYEDHIRPGEGVINIVDFLEIHDEFFRIGGQLKDIHDALRGAVAVVAAQKNPDRDTPLGGYRGLEVARLALAIEEEGIIKITKAKVPRGNHTPRNKQIRFMVAGGGSRLVPLGEWHEQKARKAYPQG